MPKMNARKCKNVGERSVEFLKGSIKGPERYACVRMLIRTKEANYRKHILIASCLHVVLQLGGGLCKEAVPGLQTLPGQ